MAASHKLSNQACLAVLIVALTTLSVPARADDAAEVTTDNNPTVTLDRSNPASTPAMQGNVKVIELDLELLKEIGLDIKNVIKAAGSLYDEVNIRPVQIITQPEVVGRGTIVYLPVGTRPIGPPAPPRKKRLDLAVNEIDPVITALKTDADDVREGRAEIGVSDAVREELKPFFREWAQIVDDIELQRTALHKLTDSPPYDNAAISKRANAIAVDAEKLDQTRRKIYKVLQKEGKKKKR
jgi:hypothetical protein